MMGYQNCCCQCNCLVPRYSQPKAILPFNPRPPNCCKCTSFVPRGRFPNDKVFFVCCQECIIKSPKDISRLYRVSSSSSSSTVEESPCCCSNQCASCLMKQMVKKTLRKGKRKSREEQKMKKHRAYDRGDSRVQTSDSESTGKAQYRRTRSSYHEPSREKNQKEYYSKGDPDQKRSSKRSEESSSSPEEREELEECPYKTPRRRRTTYDDSSINDYQPDPRPKSVKNKKQPSKISNRRDSINQRESRSKDSSAKQRLSPPRPKKISFDKSRDSLDLMKSRSNYSSKTKASKKSNARRRDKNGVRNRSQVQWGDGLYEPDPRIFGVESYNYEPCIGKKYVQSARKVTKREANASDWMRIRLEKLDQCRPKYDRLPDVCKKPCSPCQKCQTTSPSRSQQCQPCNYYQPDSQSPCYPSVVYA